MIPKKMPILDVKEYTLARFFVSATCWVRPATKCSSLQSAGGGQGIQAKANKAKKSKASFKNIDIVQGEKTC
jgi:hypothetical protein